MTEFTSLIEKLNYNYKDPFILRHALTHSSYVNDNGMKKSDSNERLEFLGDAILGAIVGEALYRKYPDVNEGKLTKLRAKIVCEKSLSDAAKKLDLGDYLKLSRGEITDDGREKPSILSDAMEAVIGSIFIDGGIDATKEFVMRILASVFEAVEDTSFLEDSKSKLQRHLQKKGPVDIEYKVREEIGAPHDKIFIIDVYCDGVLLGTGRGKNKKDAGQDAAKDAIEKEIV